MKKLSLLLLAAFLIGCGGGGGDGGGPGTVATPTLAPSPGVYTSTQNVTLSTTTPGATIRYTTDGSTPTSTIGTVYSGPIAVTSTTTVKAIAYNTNWVDSAVTSGTYTISQFSQADITGPWDVVSFRSGGNAGWFHATETFDGSGNATAIDNYLDSTGNTNPGSIPLQWTINSTGVVSRFENNVLKYLGKMSSDKKLVIWVGTQDSGTHTAQMTIARKRTGTTFNDTDLASEPFVFHALATGTGLDNVWKQWQYGAGNTNASRQLTLTSITVPSGYIAINPGPNFDTFSVSPLGFVTLAGDTSFFGLMTDDKKVIFTLSGTGTQTVGHYWFMIFMVTGQTFAQPDYAGIHPWVSMRNFEPFPSPAWGYGVTDIDEVGNGLYLSYTDSAGGLPSPSTFIRYLSTTGVITDPADSTYNGQMSYNKDITVRTNTTGASNYGLNISIK